MTLTDILIVVIPCTIFGSIAGVFAVRSRRHEQLTSPGCEHPSNLIESANRVISAIKLARFSEFTTQESVEVARTLGLDWHDESQWPDSDQQTIQLILITSRASRVHEAMVNLTERLERHQDEIEPQLRDVLEQIVAFGNEYLSRASHSEESGRVHPDDHDFLVRAQNVSNDAIDNQLTILSMKLISTTSDAAIAEQATDVIDRSLEKSRR